jgi:hypothetical protein
VTRPRGAPGDDRFTGNPDSGTGDYRLRFVRIPGANQHGWLVNGETVAGVMELGDLDTVVFYSGTGVNLSFDVSGTGGDTVPRVEIYDPHGARIGSGGNLVFHTTTAAGVYTVLVRDNRFSGNDDPGTGTYELSFDTDLPPEEIPLPLWALAALAAGILGSARRRVGKTNRRSPQASSTLSRYSGTQAG